MGNPRVHNVNAWWARAIAAPDDDREVAGLKKAWLAINLASTLLSLLAAGHCYLAVGLGTMAWGALAYAGFFLFLTVFFLWIRQGIEWFVLAASLFHVVFSFVLVCLKGGIPDAPVAVILGWAGGPLYLLLWPKSRPWALPVMMLFLATVVAEVVLQPHLRASRTLPSGDAMLLFAGFFGVLSLAVFLMIRYAIARNARVAQDRQARMAALAERKTEFYANITHELRTPLTVILGMAEQMAARPGEHFHGGLRLIRQSGNRLLYLVNQMLDLSRLEAGAMPVRFVRGDVIPFFEQLLEPYQRLAEEKQCRVRLADHPDHLELDYDPENLESLLGNLLSNAVRHAPPGSAIDVSIVAGTGEYKEGEAWYALHPQEMAGKWWSFCVEDRGKGISAADIDRLFDRFFRADTGTRPYAAGTGLGLALVRELVRLFGGNLFVKCVPGEGAAFRVYLPRRQDAPPASVPTPHFSPGPLEEDGPDEAASSASGEHPRILVVEDNPGVIHFLHALLDDAYDVSVALDGQAGIDRARASVPDLVISDVLMPVKDGYELCRTLKRDFSTSHIPVILLTVKTDRDSRITGLELGADAYVAKPFDGRELRAHVRKLIELRKGLREKYRSMALMGPARLAPANQDEAFLKKLMDLLEVHIREEDFHAGALSGMMGMSRVQLFRKLKALTGQSASDLVQSFRLHKAKTMLVDTELRISDIAYAVGYKDPAYFSRMFTRVFGLAPSAMRQQAR